jgi:diguanylate cyclase (GGDEF)-like protein
MRITITTRGIAFVALACISLIMVDGWRSWNARSARLLQAQDATANVARAAAQQADDVVRQVADELDDIAERVSHDGLDPAALSHLHQVMVEKTARLPQLHGFFIQDNHGAWLTDSIVGPHATYPHDKDAYFTFHTTHSAQQLYIGLPVLSTPEGEWVIPLSRRLVHQDGSFAGVAIAPLKISFFINFYESFELGENGSLTLALENGTVLLRRPTRQGGIGKSLVSTQFYSNYLAHEPAGSMQVKSAMDGVTRVNSFRRLPDYPLFVSAGMSREEILADWWRDSLAHLAGVICLIVMLSVCGWRLIQLRNRSEQQIRDAHGELERANLMLEKLALQDSLTGLANRRQFDQTFEAEFNRAVRHGSSIALVMMDVDFFKQYNDLYGHAAGDNCLREICKVIGNPIPRRAGDLAARYGGEELVLVLPETYLGGAVAVAESIRRAIIAMEIQHAGNPLGIVTISAGVSAMIPEQGIDQPVDLIQKADRALYAAKKAGRNQVSRVPPTLLPDQRSG